MKKIAVLTSGGDAPGMNAAIRAVVRIADYHGMEVYGVSRGYNGLINGQIEKMTPRSVADIIQRGGTILKTARCEEFKTEEGRAKAVEQIQKYGIEGVIVCGGDGSFRGAQLLSRLGIPTVGLPGTIDNDLAYTEYTLGFDTAVNTAVSAINNIRDTMTSHERVSVVEVMGRRCGDIALYAGIAGGAEVIMVPEIPVSIDYICQRLLAGKERGKLSSIIVLAEGAGHGEEISELVEKGTGLETRPVVLGHVQRGGTPTCRDRILASRMSAHAVKLLSKGVGNRLVGVKGEKIFDMDIDEALAQKRTFSKELYDLAIELAN
ncbi:6-phosphofructokinase [Gehongia tenuis]|uniref:ATP-dependent 6-phosphofructokinase n=1 Tax=Gehongia tenuis TaxID=2763655 RepID=A0A926HQ44_9FIRM|nr:6-phosphofructokinase [Gehongia tenuis]MBC8531365.1 6-phosphofructokinase [Gehongia tenuis]